MNGTSVIGGGTVGANPGAVWDAVEVVSSTATPRATFSGSTTAAKQRCGLWTGRTWSAAARRREPRRGLGPHRLG